MTYQPPGHDPRAGLPGPWQQQGYPPPPQAQPPRQPYPQQPYPQQPYRQQSQPLSPGQPSTVGLPYEPGPPQTFRRPTRPGAVNSLVWVAVIVVLVLAALATLFVIGLTTGPAGSIVGLLLAVLPVFPVAACLLWLDRYESEPPALLAFAFAWGATAAVVISLIFSIGSMIVISGAGGGDLLGAVLVAPVVEESAKALAIVGVLLIRRQQFNGVVDGIVYAGLAGLGFAFAENILYLGSAFLDDGMAGAVATFVLRGVMGPFAHPMFTSATGIGIGLAVRTSKPALRIVLPLAGLTVAMLLHALWNAMASYGGTGQWFLGYLLVQVPIFGAFVAFAIVVRRREGRLIAHHLAIYAQTGWITGQELAMLASPTGRRQARSWANRVGGKIGRKAMRDFQELASELAFLRERMAKQAAAATAPQTEADLLRTMWHVRRDFQPTH